MHVLTGTQYNFSCVFGNSLGGIENILSNMLENVLCNRAENILSKRAENVLSNRSENDSEVILSFFIILWGKYLVQETLLLLIVIKVLTNLRRLSGCWCQVWYVCQTLHYTV